MKKVCCFMERIKGVEPSCSAWEADVLPMNYTRRSVVFDIIADPRGKCNRNFDGRDIFLLPDGSFSFDGQTFSPPCILVRQEKMW